MSASHPDSDKIDDAVLALLLLGLPDECRASKGHDWDALDRIHLEPGKQGEVSRVHRQRKA